MYFTRSCLCFKCNPKFYSLLTIIYFPIRLYPLCSCSNNVITLLVQSKDVPSQRKLGQKGNNNPNKF